MALKKILFLGLTILLFACTSKSVLYHDYPIKDVTIRDVQLTDSFWLPKIRIIQNTTIAHSFEKCDEEGRMDNFLIAGKVKKSKICGKMPFDDSDLYKIIEGASLSLINSPNPGLENYLDSIIAIIKIGQEPDGYLTTWFTFDPQHPPAPWVQPSTERWENEISSHELYNSGHMFEAAAAHYRATGKRNFLDIALKNADLLVKSFGPGKLRKPPGHQVVETGLIKLYQITNDNSYLELAKSFLDWRGDSATHKLYGTYNQDHIPVTMQEEAVGHAVRAVYMYAGMTDIAAIYQDPAYFTAVNKLWENVVNKKTYLTGGLGARHAGESFGDNYELPNLTAYSETCAAIGSVYWNHRMFLLSGESKYYDIIERTLYNGLLSGISLDGKTFFYPNPLESDGAYAFNMGSDTRQSWFDCSCCPTNLIRFIPSIPGLVYASERDTLFINLYMSNNAKIIIDGNPVQVSQETAYPLDGNIKIAVDPGKNTKFTLKLRVPSWTQNQPIPGDLYSYIGQAEGSVKMKINGKEEKLVLNKSYLEITREWAKGDKVELTFPMAVRKVISNESVKDNQGLVAFEYGPLVYCAEEIDNNLPLSQLIIPEISKMEIVPGVIQENRLNLITAGVNLINPAGNKKLKSDKEAKLTLIPYYVWSNRGPGKMKVWLPYIHEKDAISKP